MIEFAQYLNNPFLSGLRIWNLRKISITQVTSMGVHFYWYLNKEPHNRAVGGIPRRMDFVF